MQVHLPEYRHTRGVHCVTTALRNAVLHYTGRLMSEAMVFGLGAGLNFSYIRDRSSDFLMVLGRGTAVESIFCDGLGIHLQSMWTKSPSVSWEFVREMIDRDRLVMVDCDMFHLSYMVNSLGLSMDLHFGGHKALVTGYDLEARTAFLSDYNWSEKQVVPLPELARARGSTDCLSAPDNTAMVFDFPETLVPLRTAIQLGLERMVGQMRGPNHLTGLRALERFRRQVTKWRDTLPEPAAIRNTRMTAFMAEKAGTGGGNFRRLYARFLREAAEVMRDDRLTAASRVYARLSGCWRRLAALMETASRDMTRGLYDPAEGGARLVTEIWDLENRGVDAVSAYLTQGGARAGAGPARR